MGAEMKLSDSQVAALRRVHRRDWPAGEPRLSWLHKGTAGRLLTLELIEIRDGTGDATSTLPWKSPIIDLTPAGRQALANACSPKQREK